jgi:hypothetical protein
MISRSIISIHYVRDAQGGIQSHVLNVAAQEWALSPLMDEAENFGEVYEFDDGRFDFQVWLHATYDVQEFIGFMEDYAEELLSVL